MLRYKTKLDLVYSYNPRAHTGQAFSKILLIKFHNFQAPNPFSRTFQGNENWRKNWRLSRM